MKKVLLIFTVVGVISFGGLPQIASAGATTNLTVSTTVQSVCTLTATGIVFPYTPGASSNATGQIDVDCGGTDTNFNVTLDQGQNYDGANRNMKEQNGSATIRYEAYKIANGTDQDIWGDSDFGNTYPAGSSVSGQTLAGTGATIPVYGTAYFGVNDIEGVYDDVLTATVYP